MWIALLFPVAVSFLLLAAHCLRTGSLALTAASLLIPFIVLLVRRPWSARLIQVVLVLAAMEWVWTFVVLYQRRLDEDRPWILMAVILGVVTLWTLCSALLFETPPLKRRYRGAGSQQQDEETDKP